ncbi:MAG: hypothetical protein WCR52_04980 [Bacteroidota bacterium]
MKRFFLPILLILSTAPLFAQYASDALRYSNIQQGGSARFLGSGGAFTALGAEFASLSQNPAGLAMFRTSELVLTPSLRFSKADATLAGNSVSNRDSKSSFGFDNFGMVFNTTPSSSKWKTFNVGIGMNRLSGFQQSVYYEGDANGTIMNGMYNEASGILNSTGNIDDLVAQLDPYYSRMAYDAQAFFVDGNGKYSYDFAQNPAALVKRNQQVSTYGRMNEMVLSFAGNYDEKLMVGATIGVPFVNYRLESDYNESDPSGFVDGFENLKYTDYLRTEGIGINGKFGLIYKVSQAFRLGASFHTPTLFGLTDTYSNTFEYTYSDKDGNHTASAQSPEGKTDYRLTTSWRAMGGAAVVIKKIGFLSADVEVVDYSANSFNLTANSASVDNKQYQSQLNRDIQKNYKQAVNLRFGGELALDQFRLRGGLDLYGKPEQGQDGFNPAYSGGLGIRTESFYIDLGYRRYTGKGSVSAYDGAPVANTNVAKSEVLLTLGFKF